MQILLVEDEYRLAQSVAKGLKAENFLVEMAYDGEDGWQKMNANEYDVVILDVMMPKLNGFELLQKMRTAGNNTPVLLLTAKSELDDKLEGFRNGADDYLTKPFAFEELLVRVQALIRRATSSNVILQVDNLVLDPQAKTVTRAGKDVQLSATEYRLLEYLMCHPNQVLNETNILEHVWDREYDGMSNIVSVYVRYVRNKVDRDFPNEQPLIHTVRGLGYKIADGK